MRNLIDRIKPKDNIIGMDFDPKSMLYLPESFNDCKRLIKGLSWSEKKKYNCHIGHNTVGNELKAYVRDSLFVNTANAMDNLHTASGLVGDTTYNGEDGVYWASATDEYVCVTTVNYTGNYYKDVKMVYDNTANGSTISITSQAMGQGGAYVVSFDYAETYFTASETFTIGANREHFGFWKLTIA